MHVVEMDGILIAEEEAEVAVSVVLGRRADFERDLRVAQVERWSERDVQWGPHLGLILALPGQFEDRLALVFLDGPRLRVGVGPVARLLPGERERFHKRKTSM